MTHSWRCAKRLGRVTTSFIEAVLDGLLVVVTLAMMAVYSVTLSLIALTAPGQGDRSAPIAMGHQGNWDYDGFWARYAASKRA